MTLIIIATLSIKGLHATLSIKTLNMSDTPHKNNAMLLSVVMVAFYLLLC